MRFKVAKRVVFGTEGGIFYFDPASRRFLPEKLLGEEFSNGSRDVFRIAEGNDNNIWFHSGGRNYRAIPRDSGGYNIEAEPFRRIFPTQANSIYPDPDGQHAWFALNDGLFRYNTAFKKNYRRPFKILIRQISIGDHTKLNNVTPGRRESNAAAKDALTISYKDRKLSVKVAAPFFENETAVRYNYFLEGYDKSWAGWTNEAVKDYINLHGGSYLFRVKAKNIYDHESEEASFGFNILPPWYITWWAVVSYVLLLGLLFYLAVRLRSARLEKDKRTLEKLIREATEEIGNKKQLLEEQAGSLQEMAAIRTRFFANVSHEFRTPLTLIMGPLEQLLSQCDDDSQRRKLEMMRRNSQRLLTLINQLLALSRIDKGKMKLNACPLNIVPFLKGMLASFQMAATQHEIPLNVSGRSEVIEIYFDPEKMEDVFSNLFLNVLHLTSPGETISVSTDVIAKENGNREGETSEYLEISVDISGLELGEEQLNHIFDRFFLAEETYENKPKGYGIGLALAKELVSLHHGEILVRHRQDGTQGTEFVLRLPMGSEHLTEDEIVDVSLFPSTFKTPPEFPGFDLVPPLVPAKGKHAVETTQPAGKIKQGSDVPPPPGLPAADNPGDKKGKDQSEKGKGDNKEVKEAKEDTDDKLLILLVEDNPDTP